MPSVRIFFRKFRLSSGRSKTGAFLLLQDRGDLSDQPYSLPLPTEMVAPRNAYSKSLSDRAGYRHLRGWRRSDLRRPDDDQSPRALAEPSATYHAETKAFKVI